MINNDMRILLVDDALSMRKIVKNALIKLGFKNFEEAEDGKEAYEKLKEGDFQFAVVDWNMPLVTGIQLVYKVRSDEALKDLKILMLTAEAEKQRVIEAIKAGVDNYLEKPFTPEALADKINKIFPDS